MILGLFGVSYGVIKSAENDKNKAKAALSESIAAGERHQRLVAEGARDFLIKSEKVQNEKIKKAVEDAKLNRDNHFN